MLENGKVWKEIESVKLQDDFSGFAVDAFSISSYTAKGSTVEPVGQGERG